MPIWNATVGLHLLVLEHLYTRVRHGVTSRAAQVNLATATKSKLPKAAKCLRFALEVHNLYYVAV